MIKDYSSLLDESMKTKMTLRAKSDGSFRFICVSDFHAQPGRLADERLPKSIAALLDHTSADLMLILGDLTHEDEGLGSYELLDRYIAQFSAPLEEREIPWAHVPGNHDREEGIPTEHFMKYPHCLSRRGPSELPGYGTFILPVYAHDADAESDAPIFVIYMMDSHTGSSMWGLERGIEDDIGLRNMTTGFEKDGGVYPAQAAWYWDCSRELEKRFGHKIPGAICMHIPIPEVRLIPHNQWLTHMKGELEESAGISGINSGLFAAAYERGDIKAIICGHDHINAFSGFYMGIELSEDAGLGYDVYGTDRMRGGRMITIRESDPGRIISEHVYLKDIPQADWVNTEVDDF